MTKKWLATILNLKRDDTIIFKESGSERIGKIVGYSDKGKWVIVAEYDGEHSFGNLPLRSILSTQIIGKAKKEEAEKRLIVKAI